MIGALIFRVCRCHPDKHPNDPTAANRFHVLKHAYDVLSDPKRRELYDRTGVDDEDSAHFWEAYDYFREKFPKISVVCGAVPLLSRIIVEKLVVIWCSR